MFLAQSTHQDTEYFARSIVSYFRLLFDFALTFADFRAGFLLAAFAFAIFLPPPILNIFVPHTVHMPEMAL